MFVKLHEKFSLSWHVFLFRNTCSSSPYPYLFSASLPWQDLFLWSGTIFNLESKVIRDCFVFALLRSVIGPGNLRRSLNPLTPMSDQDRISPYNIITISCIQEMRINTNINQGDYLLIQNQILQANIIRIVWQTVRRITIEILRVKRLTNQRQK